MVPTILICALIVGPPAAGEAVRSQSLPQEAPRVVKMVPENGAQDVDPKLEEIVITFSEPMEAGYSVTGGGEHFPKIKTTSYKNNNTVFVIRVELESGMTYNFGLNSPSFRNFRNKKGIPLDAVQVTFSTRGKKSNASTKEKSDLPSLGKIAFDLVDVNGLRVESQDYKGVPLFISFGAAW